MTWGGQRPSRPASRGHPASHDVRVKPHTSHTVTRHITPYTHHTSHITHHAITSHVRPHTPSHLTHHHTISRHMSHVFASHITHHTSRFTRQANAAALLLLNGGCVSCASSAPPEENIIIIKLRRNSGAVAEETVGSKLPACFHMKFSCRNAVQNLTRHTLVRGVPGSGSHRTVAEHEATTSPRMRIGNFNVAGIARSNFEPGVNINKSTAISKFIATIDVVSVCDRVNEPVVALQGVRGKRLQTSAWTRSPHACRGRHNVQGRRVARRRRPVDNRVTAHHKQVQGGM
jgi:hypothetical protein